MYTKDQIIGKCREVHGDRYDYSLIGNNVRMSSTVTLVCPEHGEFKQCLKNHINGKQGCPKCGRDKAVSESKSRGFQKYMETERSRFGDKYSFPNIENEYQGSRSVITIKCNTCGNVFKKRANDHITSPNGGCKVCQKNERTETYSYEDLLAKSNDKISISQYDREKAKTDTVICTCQRHGEYQVKVQTILDGRGFCKKCSALLPDSESECIKSKVQEKLDSEYSEEFSYDLSKVRSLSSRVILKCRKCGYEFRRYAGSVINGPHMGCARCTARKTAAERVKTTDGYIEQARLVHGDSYDYSKTEYIASDKKVLVKCNECGREFWIEANSHLQGHGCPYHYTNRSRDEDEILEYIKSVYNGNVWNNDRTALENGNELDIYLPEKSIAFEYDGIYWHCELNKPDTYHMEKTKLCESNGIRLVHIFEDEWKDGVKRIIWKSMISNMLGVNTTKVFARKCEIKDVPHTEGYLFLDNNHLQGRCPSTIMLGLYHGGELVSLMTFGKSRHFIGNGRYEYELLRFCSKVGTNVVGGASRLFTEFVRRYNPKSVVSYADRRWSVGGLYDALGFEKYNESKPNYYYVVGGKRKNRFNFRKSRLVEKYGCDPSISEREFCKSMKWYRIYDCGCLCYRWISPE